VELIYAILKDGRSIKHYKDYRKEHGLDDFGRKLNGRLSTNGFKIMSGKVSKTSGKRMSAKASISRISKNGEELRKNSIYQDLKRQSYTIKPKVYRSPEKEEKAMGNGPSRSLDRYQEDQRYQ
jgi:hypothetical protein